MSISFKNFLINEDVVGKNVHIKWKTSKIDSIDQFAAELKKHCWNSINSLFYGTKIQRGFSKSIDFDMGFIDTTNSKRQSRDTNNIYQLMMDNSKSLEHVPSRSTSMICSTDAEKADNFSGSEGPYIVIPFNGVDIAFINAPDIFDIHLKTIENISTKRLSSVLSSWLSFFRATDLIEVANKTGDITPLDYELSHYTPEQLVVVMSIRASPYLKMYLPDHLTTDFIYSESDFSKPKCIELFKYIKQHGTGNQDLDNFLTIFSKHPNAKFSALSNYIMTPESLGIKVKQYGQSLLPGSNECWMSGKALLINERYFNENKDELEGECLK